MHMKEIVMRDRAVWLARVAHNHKVEGSNPSPATLNKMIEDDHFPITR